MNLSQSRLKPKILAARVRALLRRSSSYEGEKRMIYKFGEFELDYDGYLLKKKDKAISLSTREIEVLRFFVKNAGRNLYTGRDLPDCMGTGIWRFYSSCGVYSETQKEN